MDEFRRANRANWNDRVPIHLGEGGYNTEKLIEEPDAITGIVNFDR